MAEPQANWRRTMLLLGIGLIVGSGLGLFFGWYVWPVEFSDADLEFLGEPYRYEYVVMSAQTYVGDNDLIAAEARLSQLGEPDTRAWFLGYTIDQILARRPETDLVALVKLANDMGLSSPAMAPYLPDGAEQ